MREKQNLLAFLQEICPIAKGVFVKPEDAVFEENPKMNCYYCEKYKKNWRCPPYLPDLNYQKMFAEFEEGLLVWVDFQIDDPDDYQNVRNESSVILHRALLKLEQWMWKNNHPNAISFIGGSCKLCRNGCGIDGCNQPALSRSPLEATGCNVVKTARKYGVDVRFPCDKEIMRIGLILWQK